MSNTTMYAAVISGEPQSLKARLGKIGPRDKDDPPEDTDLP
jgi:soluble lytic murein transglycosylase